MTIARAVTLVVIAMFAFADVARAQVPADLRAAMEGRDRAFYAADSAQWERYTAPSFTTVQQDGSFMTRAERLANLKTQKPRSYVPRSREQNTVRGDIVLARFFSGGLWVLEVWSRESGAWMVLTSQVTTAKSQQRYILAEENPNHELVITSSSDQRTVLTTRRAAKREETQEAFGDIAISADGIAVGWLSYYPNCCTSYPIPTLVEVYVNGERKAFNPAIAAWDWCFVDGSAKIATQSTTVHGPQNAVFELWDVNSGARLEDFTWMDGDEHPNAPRWVAALRVDEVKEREKKTHLCSSLSR